MVGDIFQPTHLLFVLVVALLVLGPKRLPEVGRTLGSGIRDFRQALSGDSPDPPQRQDPEQVTTTTELRHQPETAVDNEITWPEEAIGPTSFDEPVEAATAEPASAVVTDDEPATAVFADAEPANGHAGTEDASDATFAGEIHAGSETTPAEPAAGNLSFYEHALARRVSETGSSDSPESQTDQSS
jgi:sec-independent protein translocase protein TatA